MSHFEKYLVLAVAILAALLAWQFHREDRLLQQIQRMKTERSMLTLERIPL